MNEELAEPAWVEVRVAPSAARALADEWSLVLQSAGIAHQLRVSPSDVAILVEPWQAAAAASALGGYDAERLAPGVAEPAETPSLVPAAIALLLFAFWVVTRATPEHAWGARGAMDASLVRAGQWWRAITALTLHADLGHVLGNAAAMVVFLGPVAARLGGGVAALLVLAAGAFGNLLTARWGLATHLSIGASTATFGALGLLTGLAVLRRAVPLRRRVLPLGAALALLMLLGVGSPDAQHIGPTIDVLAHVSGLLAGLGLGLVAALLDGKLAFGWFGQLACGLAAALTVAEAWSRAGG